MRSYSKNLTLPVYLLPPSRYEALVKAAIRQFQASYQPVDPRYFQLVWLGMFLLYGILQLGWHRDAWHLLALWSSALLTQMLFCRIYKKPYDAWKSAAITALGLSLLLRAGDVWVYALAGFLSIASKFLIRHKGKHVFNPANFALVACVFGLKAAWVSPGQWGSDALLLFFIGGAGLMVLLRSARLDTAFTFLLVLLGAEFVRSVLWLGWPADFLLHRFSNGSLLLFSFFMITDPMTTPNHPLARRIWAAAIALFTFWLSSFHYMQTAPVIALFLFSLSTPFFDRIWKHLPFQWNRTAPFPKQAI